MDNLTDKRLQELIDDSMWKPQKHIITKNDIDIQLALQELKSLRELVEEYEDTIGAGQIRLESQRRLTEEAREQNKALIEDAKRLASEVNNLMLELSDGYDNAWSSGNKSIKVHEALMQEINEQKV